MGAGSSGSGKWRALGLLNHPEALDGPPGGPGWRRPLLTLVIGLVIVAAILFIADALRDDLPSFDTFVSGVECDVGTEKGTTCFEISVINVGRSPGHAVCSWDGGRFATGVIAPNEHETRTIEVRTSAGQPDVVCRPATG
jgi:hypothetical protein